MATPELFSDDDWDDELEPAPAAPRAPSAATARLRMGVDDVFYDELQAAPEFFDKVFSATPDLPIEFIDQAEVLCRMSKARAPHWVTVRNAYGNAVASHVVLPSCPTSVQKLANEGARLRQRELHAVVAGTIAGLRELARLLRRPHGNLKASNVLLRSRRLRPESVALTDPAPTMRAKERGTAFDLRRLGEVVHLLVLRRLPHAGEPWPLPASREWRDLGRAGDRWRDFCSRLLDPAGTRLTLDDVARVARRLGARPVLTFARRATVTVLVAAALGGAAFLGRDYLNRQHPDEVQKKLVVAPQSPQSRPATREVAIVIPPTAPQLPATDATPAASIAHPPFNAFVLQRAVERGTSGTRSLLANAGAAVAQWEAARLTASQRLEVARFIDDCNRPVTGVLPPIAAALEAENRHLVEEATRNPARLPPQLVAERERVGSRLREVDRVARSLPDPTDLPKPSTPLGESLATRLKDAARTDVAAHLTDMVRLAAQPEATAEALESALETFASKSVADHAQVASCVRDVDRAAQRLAEGFTPDAAPDGEPIRDVVNRWGTSPPFGDAGAKATVTPLVLNATDAAALRKTATTSDALPGLRLAAWQSDANPPPATREDLERDLATRDALLDVASKLDPPRRRAPVTAGILAVYASRWQAYAARAKADDVAFAMDAAARPADLDTSKLTGAARWNVGLFELRSIATDGRVTVTLPRAQALVNGLLKTSADLPPAARQPQVAALVGRLREWSTQATTASDDLTLLGPASAKSSSARWIAEPDATGATIAFRTASSQDAPLIFRRVASPDGDVYLCTVETSLGLFNDAIAAANRWRDVKESKLLGTPDATPRGGPHGWRWSPRPDGGIVKSLVWLPNDWVPPGADDYPDTLGNEFNRATLRDPRGEAAAGTNNPSRLQPMQQLSAEAAKYFAALVGCRLPTPAEWKLAYATLPQPTRGANLRDRSWRLELDHMSRTWPRQASGVTGYRPDAEAFVPAGEPFSNDVWRAASGEEYDDGVLWFREVSAPALDTRDFQNLAGNVGEFVRDPAGKTFVIGGSSLSPPTRPLDQPFEVDARDMRRGFADVGVRLAFSAPFKPLERLASILSSSTDGYVSAASK